MSPGFRVQYNYIHENNIISEHYGLYFRAGASYNFVYKNSITNCKNAIMLSSAYNNQFIGNNISKSTEYAVSLGTSDYNTFYYNNFVGNTIQAYEMHELYWFTQNNTYYSENNTWDNGKEGNYWSGYSGSDTNSDGIGGTPHNVYEAFTDRYPLTAPYNINKIVINREKWDPTQNEILQLTDQLQIVILSPENITYNTASVALNVTTSIPFNLLGISIDFQSNTTISGNITLANLSQGPHSLTVYGNTSQGVNASSETIYFTIDAPETFPIIPITTLSVAIIAVSSAGLALYLKKHKN